MENLSLYIHIPFCESKCYYCNFVSTKATEEEKKKYVDYLIKEIEINSNKDYLVTSIFIGGGTPSCLKAGEISRILNAIYNNFVVEANCEITIECNPNSFTSLKAEEYKKCKINRISFGLQSSNNKLLKLINRVHSKKDFINAINLARSCGFNNLSADILLGIPNQKICDVKNTLKLLIKLKINHISCYSLILEENTKLYKLVHENKLKLPSEEKTIKMYDLSVDYLKKHRIYRYEVSNFAKKGFECMHNLTYWNLGNYLGLGLNSHSKINNIRFENFEGFNDYYEAINKNLKPIKNSYNLSSGEQKEEFIMLGLRKSAGINLNDYFNLFNERLEIVKAKEINFLLKNNFIHLINDNLMATDLGFKVLNQIIIRLV